MAVPAPSRRSGVARRLAPWAEGLGVFAVYTLITGWFLRPVWRVGADRLAPDLGDPLFNLYVLTWVGRQLRSGLPDLWGASFFFPLPDALALSDHLIGPAAAALLLAPLAGGMVGAYNALLVLSFALSGTTTWAVLRATGLGRTAAFAGGAVFAFAPYRWQQLSHLQVLLAQWVPPLLWSFDRLLARPGARRAALFLAFYALHLTGGNYLAFLVHVPLAALLVNRLAGPDSAPVFAGRSLRVLLPAGLACAAMVAALFLPYVEISRRLGLEREPENFRLYGANLVAQLTPAPGSPHFRVAAERLRPLAPGLGGGTWVQEKALFPGLLPTALAAIGAVAFRRRHRRRTRTSDSRRRVVAALGFVALAAFLAADLYTLGWWPHAVTGPRRTDGVYTLLGTTFLAAAAARAYLVRRWTGLPPLALPDADRWERGIVWAGLATWLVSFPVVFEPLAEALPGFANLRVPARAHMLTLFAVAWLAARGVAEVTRRLRAGGPRVLAGAALAIALLAELAPSPVDWQPVPPVRERPVYGWIATHPEVEAILELPLRDGHLEMPYVWASTRHRRPIVNGFSGHTPPDYDALRRVCCWPVPGPRALALLRRLGVTHVVVHGGELPARWNRRELARWEATVEAGEVAGVRRVYADSRGDRVFAIDRPDARDGRISPSPEPRRRSGGSTSEPPPP